MDEYETQLKPDGSFSLSIPLFCDAFGLFVINENDYGAFSLSPDKETKIKLSLDDKNQMQVKLIKGVEISIEDIQKSNPLYMDFYQKLSDGSLLSGLRYDMTPEEYRDYIINQLKEQISIIEKSQEISEYVKQTLYRIMKLNTFGQLSDYEVEMKNLYFIQQPENEENAFDFTPTKIDKSYYSFLDFYDVNNPPLSNYPFYPRLYQHLLNSDILNIPRIDSNPLPVWMKEVKTIMADLVGSDTGLFYDMLALHAYLQQLEESATPLSTGQIEEIKSFFKNPTYTHFLFAENDALIKQLSSSKTDNKQTFESIISSYKGKVVVVDFWATWCRPCLQAMEEIKPIKEKLKNKNVVFVYITDPSSPQSLWETKKEEIGGEHYYLTDNEMKYIKARFQISGIPAYQIYDSTGILKHKFVGFPGAKEMQKMIEELLP
jgi:thiol-disulfide isomerase/thioredoxin